MNKNIIAIVLTKITQKQLSTCATLQKQKG